MICLSEKGPSTKTPSLHSGGDSCLKLPFVLLFLSLSFCHYSFHAFFHFIHLSLHSTSMCFVSIALFIHDFTAVSCFFLVFFFFFLPPVCSILSHFCSASPCLSLNKYTSCSPTRSLLLLAGGDGDQLFGSLGNVISALDDLLCEELVVHCAG